MKYLAAQTSITRFWNFLVLCTETGTERYVCGESSMSGGRGVARGGGHGGGAPPD